MSWPRTPATSGPPGATATPPPYAHPTDAEVVRFFTTVTDAVDIPWMVYNWPRGTAVDLAVSTCVQLADLDRVVALKDSTADELKSAQTCEAVAGSIRFFGRFIHRRGMALARELGGDGNIDGGGLGAAFAVPYFEALWRDDLDTARKLGVAYGDLMGRLITADYSGRFASPTAQIKAAMNLLGQPGGRVRPPLADVDDDATLAAIAAALRAGGLDPAEPPETPRAAAMSERRPSPATAITATAMHGDRPAARDLAGLIPAPWSRSWSTAGRCGH